MSKKIIGVTVGTQLPKPNFKQTDPTKGDYIKNRPDFDGLKDRGDAIVVPTKVSQLNNDSGYITNYTETDPTVPSWAKQSTKPSYTKSEIGLGNVDNVRQYSAENPPVVAQPEPPEDKSVIWVDTDDNTVDGVPSGYVMQNEAPLDTSVLWIDPSDTSDNRFQEAVNIALAQAKASGEFDGEPYKLTDEDKAAIVSAVISALPVYSGEVV